MDKPESGDINGFLEKQRPAIDIILEKYLPRRLDAAALEQIFGRPRYAYDQKALTEAISMPIWDFLDRGGKRIRPALFLMVAEALGADMERVKDFAAVIELAHEGSIIADDLEDNGEIRRGKPCMHKLFGDDIAINASSFMYFLPALVFMKHRRDFDGSTLLNAWETFAQEMINIHGGQGMDIFWHKGSQNVIGENEYMQMCAYKTGCLTRMAVKMAAVLSGTGAKDVERLGRFGEMIGVGFQIQDDVLSASGSEFQCKKGYGDDITEGKRTLIVIHALKHASEKDRKRLLEILNAHTRDKPPIREALGLLAKYGSVRYAKEKAKALVRQAWKEADAVLPESGAKMRLKALADFIIERKI